MTWANARSGYRVTIWFATLVVVGLLCGGIGAVGATPADAGDIEPPDLNETAAHPSIESGLIENDHNAVRAATSAGATRTVVVEATPDHLETALEQIATNGTVLNQHGRYIQAELTHQQIRHLGDSAAISFIRAPRPLQQSALTSEGSETIAADIAHERGATGDGSTVAIIDAGFDPNHDPIAANVVETRDFTGDGLAAGGTQHGNAVAEIVVSTAPDADIILISVSNDVEFANAAEWVNEHEDIDVATASLGLFGLPNDGTSFVDTAIESGPDSGTAWTIAAGNSADGAHWSGPWSDAGSSEGLLAFDGSGNDAIECNAFSAGGVGAILQWDDWTNPSEQYALRLYRYDETADEFELVDVSNNNQAGGAPPVEFVSYQGGDAGTYCLAVAEDGGDGTASFNLFMLTPSNANLEVATAERSITVPATNREALAVGAVRWNDEELEAYSSQGPTIDGRLKPELVAPARVSTEAYGSNGFPGTSAAAPHVAGAAAVVHSANRSATGMTLQNRLLHTARSTAGVSHSTTPNNAIGHGLVDVSRALPPQNPTGINVDQISATDDSTTVEVTFDHQPLPGDVLVQVEDTTGTIVTEGAPLETASETTSVEVPTEVLAPGEITIRAGTADAYGWRNTDGMTATTTVTKTEPVNLNAAFTITPTIPDTDTEILFDASATETETDIERYQWEFGDGTTTEAATATVTHTYAEPGEYKVTLTVTDVDGTTDTTTATIVVDGVAGLQPYVSDSNGTVTTDGLRAAIADWRAGEIDTNLLRSVIDAWRSGDPV